MGNQINQKEKDISISERDVVIKEFTFALNDFSAKADPKNISDHRSYVYALCEKVGDSLVPFYIGEGKGARVWSHELETADQVKLLEEELAIEGRSEEIEERKQDLSEKIRKIDEIKARGGEIVKYIVKWGMTSKEAFMVESALINLLRIGGLRFDSGDKDRLTNKILGHQSEGEKQTGTTKARTVEEFREEFAKEPLFFEDLKEEKVNALLININAGYPECLKFMKKEEREKAMRDTACGNWRMREIDALEKSGIEYVFATVQARIVGIYKIKEVNGKRFHYVYESAEVNSEYPHGEGVVPFRNGDYEFAQYIVTAAKSKGKHPSELVLDDMPSEYKKEFIEKIDKENLKAKEKKDPSLIFKNSLERKYMILEDISEDDPNYSRYMGYLHRRVIHTDAWVEEMKRKTDNIYGSGNPIKYIE